MTESIVKTEGDKLDAFEQRMRKRKEDDAAKDKQKTEVMRAAYLKRTGRKELKP